MFKENESIHRKHGRDIYQSSSHPPPPQISPTQVLSPFIFIHLVIFFTHFYYYNNCLRPYGLLPDVHHRYKMSSLLSSIMYIISVRPVCRIIMLNAFQAEPVYLPLKDNAYRKVRNIQCAKIFQRSTRDAPWSYKYVIQATNMKSLLPPFAFFYPQVTGLQ